MALNLLIIDDSRVVQRMVAKTMELSGLELGEVHRANNGREGLEKLNEHWIDAVLTDLYMPEMTGFEMIREMASTDALKNLPVIVISTEGNEDRIKELLDLGVRAFLRKPFTPEQLREVVHRVLGLE